MSNSNNSKGGGRHKDPVWGFYEEVTDNLSSVNISNQKCKGCGQLVSAKVLRLKKHLEKCANNKPTAEEQVQDEIDKSLSQSKRICLSNSEKTSVSTEVSLPNQNIPSKTKQPGIERFLVATTEKQRKDIDIEIAKYFYSCNIPFNTAGNECFKNMISKLRPGYEPPNRLRLAGDLLDNVHSEAISTMQKELQGKTVTLMQDGWSNIHNSPIIVNCVSTGKKSFFLSAIETGASKKTAQYCLKLATDAKEEVENKFACKVRSFVSDNENKMKRMREDFQNAYRDELFISYGCAAHYMNLAGQDITNNVSSIMKHVIEVQKYFRNNHGPAGYLSEYETSVKPQLPGETRWNSQIDCLTTFLKNRDFYMKIVDEHEDDIDANIVKIVNNVGIYKVKHLQSQLMPISFALDKLQREDATISDACDEWLSLLKVKDLETYSKLIQSRFNENVTPAHFLAHMLNPVYMGKGIDEEKQEIARQWLHDDIDPTFLSLVIAFQAESSPYPKSYFSESVKNNVGPDVWWEAMKKVIGIDIKFVEFTLHLMNCCASSSSVERLFSKFGTIQCKLRNRLSLEKTAKLVTCNRFLNSTQKGDFV